MVKIETKKVNAGKVTEVTICGLGKLSNNNNDSKVSQ